MDFKLTQNQRIATAIGYLCILILIFKLIGGDFKSLVWSVNIDSSIWFYSGAFMIILGKYVVEPLFTKPSDAIANSTAVLIALFGLTAKQDLFWYSFIFYYSMSILAAGILSIALKDASNELFKKMGRVFYTLVSNLGNASVIFSVVYLLAAYSYFSSPERLRIFILMVALWVCLTFFDVIGLVVSKFSKLIAFIKNKTDKELGQAIGCENPLLYKVEVDYTKHNGTPAKYGDLVAVETSINTGSIGMVVDSKHLLNKRWLSIYLLQDTGGEILRINLKDRKLITETRSIFVTENLAYLLDPGTLDPALMAEVNNNTLFKKKDSFIGYVSSGSNINTVNFSIVREMEKASQTISEGSILSTLIYGEETLYQVINGSAKEEQLENFDRHGFIVGIARKLGKYDVKEKELNTCKWMPKIFTPVFLLDHTSVTPSRIKEIATNSIGRLPETDFEIPIKDADSLVTHNTAVLGILGIGKSCLTFELIQKIILKTSVKVVCIDITNEYKKEIPGYIQSSLIEEEMSQDRLTELKSNNNTGNQDNPTTWGNEDLYKIKLDEELKAFNDDGTKRVLFLNPDWHPVSKAGSQFKINHRTDLTIAEKTRIISERIFVLAKSQWDTLTNEEKETNKARFLIVFEEAHSLVPEWNSTANEGDQNASNGTAKVILQGRKYGLGSIVVTQRTANISKSILNQCNTVFALRVFDDTGKQFLENYIGKDYADTLPTLEERHAIAIGKGLKLKQPVIIELNDRSNFVGANVES